MPADLGFDLAFRIDGLSAIFLLLILGIGFPIQAFALEYFRGGRGFHRYLTPMLLFVCAMLGVVTADNLLLLFIFWELTSFASFLLIGMNRERPAARHGAQMALIITAGGGLFLLAGFLLLAEIGGSYSLSYLLQNAASFRDDPRLVAAFFCVAVGALTKSAQFPFHFWLPGAMAAPAPVSAYLHSATMVKAGIYLLARFYPVFASLEMWSPVLVTAGAASFVWGSWVAFHKDDLKALLANTTISGLGLLTFGLGLGSDRALVAVLVFTLAHALYKAPLFLMAGLIEKKIGTRDLRELSGVRGPLPVVGWMALLACLSMAGFPFFIGFVAKEEFISAAMDQHYGILLVLILGSALNIAVACRLAFHLFWQGPAAQPLRVSPAYLWPLVVLSSAGLLGAFGLRFLSDHIFDPALVSVGATQSSSELSLWHGFTPALALSLFILALGVLIFVFRRYVHNFGTRHFFEGDMAYEKTLRGSLWIGDRLTRLMQTGSLPYYILLTMLALLAVLYAPLMNLPEWSDPTNVISLPRGIVLVLIIVAAMEAVLTRSAMASILAMGIAGFGLALFFSLSGAPDLAMTQFSVECLALILFVLCLKEMPGYRSITSIPVKFLQGLVALSIGGVLTAVTWAGLEKGSHSRLTEFFSEQSLKIAYGHNVVNVILVDFRGLDTMGEISVLAIAALGVVVILGGFPSIRKGGRG